MKLLLPFGLFLVFTLQFSNTALSLVWVTSVTENNPPSTNCTPTSFTVAGDLSATHTFAQSTVSVSGSTITIGVEYLSGIGIPVITPFSQIVDLGLLSAGTYTVVTNGILDGVIQSTNNSSLTVTSCCGTSADFTYPTDICLGDQIVLTNSSTGAISQEWFEDGSSTSTSVNHSVTPTTSGSIVFKLVTTDGICHDSVEYTVNVLNIPTITALTPNQASYCEGDVVEITNNSANANYFFWTENGTFVSAFSTLQTTATAPGMNTYKLLVSNNACSDSMEVTITVNASPTIDTFNASQSSICQGESLDLTSSSTGATTIQWYENGAFLTNGSNLTVTPSSDGTYTYQLIISAANNCMDSAEAVVIVNPLPIIDAFSVSETTLCLGDTLQLASSSSNATSFEWFENGASVANTNDHTTFPSPVGSYTYQLLVGLGNCFDSTDQVVNVVGLPTVDLGADTNDCLGPIVLDAGSGLSSYLWQDQSTNQTLTPTTTGTYSVTITDGNGCTAYDEMLFETCSGIDEAFIGTISVFPNPVESNLQIQLDDFEGTIDVMVSNLKGKQLLNKSLFTSGLIDLNLENLSAGIYYVQLKTALESQVFKIVKE